MITAALLSAPIEGSIFGPNTTLLDRSRTIHHHHTSYNVLLVPGFHIAARQPEDTDRPGPVEAALADGPSSSPNQKTGESSDKAAAAPPPKAPPFTIRTTLSFDDPDISKYDVVDLGGLPLFVLNRTRTRLSLPPQPPIHVARTENTCNLVDDPPWQAVGRKRNYRTPQAYPEGQAMTIDGAKLRSQLWFDRNRTASLYGIPTDTRFTIAGQNMIFSSNTFCNLYLLIVRKHEMSSVYIRRIALLCLPHQSQTKDQSHG